MGPRSTLSRLLRFRLRSLLVVMAFLGLLSTAILQTVRLERAAARGRSTGGTPAGSGIVRSPTPRKLGPPWTNYSRKSRQTDGCWQSEGGIAAGAPGAGIEVLRGYGVEGILPGGED